MTTIADEAAWQKRVCVHCGYDEIGPFCVHCGSAKPPLHREPTPAAPVQPLPRPCYADSALCSLLLALLPPDVEPRAKIKLILQVEHLTSLIRDDERARVNLERIQEQASS